MKSFAIVISGCGYLDGSEITETISTLICLDQKKCSYDTFAPNTDYFSVNHNNQSAEGKRNSLDEAARITRGKTKNISELNPDDFDGLILPGGYGAAKSLSNWAERGSSCTLNHNLESIIKSFHTNSKPILAICIAPVLVAKALGKDGITLTIGNDASTATEIEKTGAIHENCVADDYVTDRLNKLITTPAYMYDSTPAIIFSGVSKAINEFYEMA